MRLSPPPQEEGETHLLASMFGGFDVPHLGRSAVLAHVEHGHFGVSVIGSKMSPSRSVV